MTVVPLHAGAVPPPAVEPAETHRFMMEMYPAGPWLVHLIPVEGGEPEIVVVDPRGSADEGMSALSKALEKNRRGTHNAYFPVNPSRRVLSKKAAKDDIDHAVFLHADIDYRAGEDLAAEGERVGSMLTAPLPRDVPQPSAVVASGGGYWAFWRLREPAPVDGTDGAATKAVEDRNRQLVLLLGADDCHNIDRIARLPGTVNWPKADKRRKGRVAALARVVEMRNDRAYDLADFDPMQTVGPAGVIRPPVKIEGPVAALASVDELDKWEVPDRVKVVIVQGRDDDRPKANDNSRSAWVFDVCCQLARRGVPDQVILAVLMDSGFGISESVLEKGGKARAYAIKQIEKARAAIALDDAGWVEINKHGEPLKSFRNTLLAVARLGVECRWNVFRNRFMVESEALGALGGELNDNACVRLRQMVIETFNFDPGKDHVADAARQLALANPFDPVVDFLETAQAAWDGVPRLGRWLTTYLGGPDDELTRAIGSAMLVAAVRRARQPGCKFDFITVLEGPQGSGKSSALRILAGSDDVFSDAELLHLDGRGQMEAVQGIWIYEQSELSGLRAADVEKVKAFSSRTHDCARAAYDRFTSNLPRRCIFVGTTNKDDYLRDATGNRRFWPVRTGAIDLEALRRDRNQLWAEAAIVEAGGEPLGLPESLWKRAAEVQLDRVAEDSWADVLRAAPWERHTHDRKRVLTEQLYRLLKLDPRDQTPAAGARLRAVMERLGWTKTKVKDGGRSLQGYVAPLTDAEQQAIITPKLGEPF